MLKVMLYFVYKGKIRQIPESRDLKAIPST